MYSSKSKQNQAYKAIWLGFNILYFFIAMFGYLSKYSKN